MFSGKKFRLWSKQSSSKKDAEKESSKNKSKTTLLLRGEDERCREPNTPQEKSHLQKLQEGYARLEETVEELTPFKTKACALEKKLIYITKSYERKQSQCSTVIASLEVENEQLRKEIHRMKSICGSCYFCCRHRMMSAHSEAAKHFHSSQRADQSSSESLGSSESWRRLQKLEEEQSAIARETSRQKQETSRCLEKISCEVMKAIVSQKALRKDCARLQCRILQLEKQNGQLNEVIFRQYPPSQTNFLTGQRNEVSVLRPQQASLWDKHSAHSTSSLEILKDGEKTTSHKPFRIPPGQRFSKEICRPTSDCMLYNYIPEQDMVNSDSTRHTRTNHDHQSVPSHGDVSLIDSVPKNAQGGLRYVIFDNKNEGKKAHNWESSTGSTFTLRDETVKEDNDSMTNHCKFSPNRGSMFSLNDILDGDIDELQLSIQSQESTRNNNTTGNTNNISKPGDGKETLQLQKDCQPQNSKTAKFTCDSTDRHALQITSDVCPSSGKQMFKERKEPTQVPFSRDAQSMISFDNCNVAKRDIAAEKWHRYSYPYALSDKSSLKSDSTGMNMSESIKALQSDAKPEQDFQNFRLWNFENSFDDSDMEKLGTIKERTVPVTGNQHKVRVNGALDRKPGAKRSVNENSKMSTPVQADILQETTRRRAASGGSLSQESVLVGDASNESTAQQNQSQRNVLERDALQETPRNGDSSDGKFIMGSPLNSNALWANNWRVTQLEVSHSRDDPSLAMHTIKQDAATEHYSRPNCCNCMPMQVIRPNERKQEQNDIPAQSVDIKAKTEDAVHKKRDSFDFTSTENTSKDLARDVIMSKDKVMALTAYFEEVHAEQCPDCQHIGTRCKISSSYRRTSGSKDTSSSEDDVKRLDENKVADFELNQKTQPQDIAPENLITDKKLEFPMNETLTCQLSVNETSKYDTVIINSLVCDTSIQATPHIRSDDSNISKNALACTKSRANRSPETDSQLEGAHLKDKMEEEKKSELEQFEHNLNSSLGDFTMCRLGRKNLTKTPSEQLVSKHTQWKSLPSVSLSTSYSHPPLQINCIRTLSLKSFSDVLTPPPSPKSHMQNEINKPLGHPHGHFRKGSEDMFNIYPTYQVPQLQSQNRPNEQPQGNSQSNTKSHSDQTEKESQGCFQNYSQNNCQGLIQEKQSTAQNYPQETHLSSPGHSKHQGQFSVFKQDESHSCAQNYLYDHLQDDLLYPNHHSPKINQFLADKGFTTQEQPGRGCVPHSFAIIPPDDERADLISSAYPDLVSGSFPRSSNRRSQRSTDTDRKCNVLTEEDIMKYRLDCQGSRRTVTDNCPTGLQSNIVSLAAIVPGSPGYSGGLRMLATKPPLPPRRLHVDKYYVRDGLNPPLDPQDFLNFEKEFLGFSPVSPHSNSAPIGNEFFPEPTQRTPGRDMDKNCATHSRGVDFNYPGADETWRGGENNSLALPSATISHSQLMANSKAGTYVSSIQGYQSVVGCQSSGKRNSFPDCSGRAYSQPQTALWDDKSAAVDMTINYAQEGRQTIRPVSSHQATETANYGFNSALYGSTAQRKLPAHCQQLEGENSRKNKKDAESDFVFKEISKQIENLQQTVSELQKKSTKN